MLLHRHQTILYQCTEIFSFRLWQPPSHPIRGYTVYRRVLGRARSCFWGLNEQFCIFRGSLWQKLKFLRKWVIRGLKGPEKYAFVTIEKKVWLLRNKMIKVVFWVVLHDWFFRVVEFLYEVFWEIFPINIQTPNQGSIPHPQVNSISIIYLYASRFYQTKVFTALSIYWVMLTLFLLTIHWNTFVCLSPFPSICIGIKWTYFKKDHHYYSILLKCGHWDPKIQTF